MAEFPNASIVPVAIHLSQQKQLAYSASLQSDLARKRVPFNCKVVAITGGVSGIGGTTVPSAVGFDVLVRGTIANGKLGLTTPATLLLAGTTTGAAVASSTPSSDFQGMDLAFTATRGYLELVAGEILSLNAIMTGTTNSTADGLGVTVWVVPK